MDPSILSFETINKLKLSFEYGIPRPQDIGHLCFRRFFLLSQTGDRSPTSKSQQTTCYFKFFFNFTVKLQCLQRALGRRVTEKSHFSTQNVCLARTGNRTQATCLDIKACDCCCLLYVFSEEKRTHDHH
jgi:hypothetical protein